MASNMTLQDAASQLDTQLRKYSWYLSVGIGTTQSGDTIFVYVKSLKHRELGNLAAGWQGYPVSIRQIGSIRAVEREESRVSL
jgi:hypothetical protein